MNLTSESIQVIKIKGRLDIFRAVEIESQLKTMLNSGCSLIVLDLSGLEYLSSSGLRICLDLLRQINARKGKLALCGMNPTVRKMFHMVEMEDLFEIHKNLGEALSSF